MATVVLFLLMIAVIVLFLLVVLVLTSCCSALIDCCYCSSSLLQVVVIAVLLLVIVVNFAMFLYAAAVLFSLMLSRFVLCSQRCDDVEAQKFIVWDEEWADVVDLKIWFFYL